MAITHVGTDQGNNNPSATALSIATPLAAGAIGNLIWVAGGVSNNGHTMTLDDTQGNTWIQANPNFDDPTPANNAVVRSWYCLAKNTNLTTITLHQNLASFMAISVQEFTGVDQVAPLDQVTHSAAGAAGVPTSPAFTPTYDGELICAFTLDNVTGAGNIDGSAATLGGADGAGDDAEWRILSGRAGVSMTAAFATSAPSGAFNLIVATFRPPQTGRVPYQPAYLGAPMLAQ